MRPVKAFALALLLSTSVALSGCGYFYPFADNRARASIEAMDLTAVKLTRTAMGLSCSKSDHILVAGTLLISVVWSLAGR